MEKHGDQKSKGFSKEIVIFKRKVKEEAAGGEKLQSLREAAGGEKFKKMPQKQTARGSNKLLATISAILTLPRGPKETVDKWFVGWVGVVVVPKMVFKRNPKKTQAKKQTDQ